ncbi:uncharacterized protein LOC100182868 isoform X1 [Ciona intestinalis]
MANVGAHQASIVYPAVPVRNRNRYKNVIMGLAITETILGVLSIVLGIVLVANKNEVPVTVCHYYPVSTCRVLFTLYFPKSGEGLWTGVWVLIAGILGIFASRNRPSSSVINAHMGLSITAAVFSLGQVVAGIVLAFYTANVVYLRTTIVLAAFGFISFVLCIVSASFGCPHHTVAIGSVSCCGAGCCETDGSNPQAVYVQQPPQQVVVSPGAQPGMVHQNEYATSTAGPPLEKQAEANAFQS